MIDISVLDEQFNILGVIDTYESFIWTDRFNTFGDFELYTGVTEKILNICKQDHYLIIPNSPHMMIIEDIGITTDPENGNHITIKGRSLESILDRRIIWDTLVVSSGKDHTLATAIEILVKSCFGCNGNNTGEVVLNNNKKTKITVRKDRTVTNFYYLKPQKLDIVTPTMNQTQYTGENLYDIIYDILESNPNIGYRILPLYSMRKYYTDDYIKFNIGLTDKQFAENLNDYSFIFELYSGFDRSYEQDELPYVVFSPYFDNILNTDYYDSISTEKNVTLVSGEDQGSEATETSLKVDTKRIIVGGYDKNKLKIPPLKRRELFTDARDLQSEEYGGKDSDDYEEALKVRGLENLNENSRTVTYDGQVETTHTFTYGKDFIMGDIIQIKNEYDIEGRARVVEYIISDNESETTFYPTFSDVIIVSDEVEDDTVERILK